LIFFPSHKTEMLIQSLFSILHSVMRCCLIGTIHDELERRKRGCELGASELLLESGDFLFQSARDVSRILSVRRQSILNGGCRQFDRLGAFAHVILDRPSVEEGGDGPLDFTLSIKLAEVQVFLDVLGAIGWSFGMVSTIIESIHRKIALLVGRPDPASQLVVTQWFDTL
jgi:hypothetical protein